MMNDSDLTDVFFDLTPERVLAAVELAGLECNNLCYPLNSFENRVYEVELVDQSRVVAKFYRPGRWTRNQILEEHTFLSELDAAEVPVCSVRPFPDQATLKEIEDSYRRRTAHAANDPSISLRSLDHAFSILRQIVLRNR